MIPHASADPVPRWRPVPLLLLLRSRGLGDRRVRYLLLGWAGAAAVAVASGLLLPIQDWTGMLVRVGRVDIALTIYPPLIICTWLVFWLGLEWGFLPAYVATLIIGLQHGMSVGLAALFALADPIGLAVIALAYRAVTVRYDLRSLPSALWYVTVAFVSALAGSTGALIWSRAGGLSVFDTLTIWEGWWVGALLQALLVNAPVLALVSGRIERTKQEWLGPTPHPPTSFHWVVGSVVVGGLAVAGFVWGATGLGRARLRAAVTADGDPTVQALVGDALSSWDLVTGASLLLLALLVLGGVALAVVWNRAVENEAASGAEQIRFQAGLLDAVEEAVISTDTAGRITYWNAFAERLYGWKATEVLGRTITDVVVPIGEQQRTREVIDRLARGEGWSGECRLHRRDGSEITVRLTTSPIHDGDGTVVGNVSVSADTSGRRQVEEQLRLFAAAVEQAKEAVVITTSQLEPPGPKIVYVNPAFESLTGYPAAEVLGKTPRILQGPATDRATLNRLKQTLAAGSSFSGQVVNYRRDGTPFDLEWRDISPIRGDDGEVLYYVAIQRDVTYTKAAERALRASEERFRRLVERAWDGIVLVDAGGTIHFASESARRMLGYAPRELMGRPLFELMSADHRAAAETALRELQEQPGKTTTLEVRARHRNGSWRWVEAVVTNLLDDPSVGSIVLNYRDITERHQAERVLRESREQLRELARRLLAVREEERTAVAREIHDELGQALTALKMDVAWLASRASKKGGATIERLRAMRLLVDETVETVRRIATDLRPGVLDDLGLVAAIEWQAEEFERRTGVRTTVQIGTRQPDLDDGRTTTVFRILQEALTNVARHADARHVDVSFAVRHGVVILDVRDDGRGISHEHGDTGGLGISGMRERAALWGGELEIARLEEGGTRVTARIPRPRSSGEVAR